MKFRVSIGKKKKKKSGHHHNRGVGTDRTAKSYSVVSWWLVVGVNEGRRRHHHHHPQQHSLSSINADDGSVPAKLKPQHA